MDYMENFMDVTNFLHRNGFTFYKKNAMRRDLITVEIIEVVTEVKHIQQELEVGDKINEIKEYGAKITIENFKWGNRAMTVSPIINNLMFALLFMQGLLSCNFKFSKDIGGDQKVTANVKLINDRMVESEFIHMLQLNNNEIEVSNGNS